MNILIPYINSTWAGTELKYALRSIEKHVQFDRVFIIGDKPDWLCNVTHIPFKDNPNIESKERNIMQKILEACKTDISQKFLFSNDDIFILKDIPNDYPAYYSGLLPYHKGDKLGAYKTSTNNTINVLQENALTTMNFDIHRPCIYDKDFFPEVMSRYDWRKPYGYVIKSLYFNSIDAEIKQAGDLKISMQLPFHRLRKTVEGQDIFSIGDRAIGLPMKKLLDLYFSEPSKFEL